MFTLTLLSICIFISLFIYTHLYMLFIHVIKLNCYLETLQKFHLTLTGYNFLLYLIENIVQIFKLKVKTKMVV